MLLNCPRAENAYLLVFQGDRLNSLKGCHSDRLVNGGKLAFTYSMSSDWPALTDGNRIYKKS